MGRSNTPMCTHTGPATALTVLPQQVSQGTAPPSSEPRHRGVQPVTTERGGRLLDSLWAPLKGWLSDSLKRGSFHPRELDEVLVGGSSETK